MSEKFVADAPVIDGFADLVEIGTGGYSVVYSATQAGFDRRVAIKVFNLSGAEARRIEREARALGRLSDLPGLIQAYQVTRTGDGRPALVMALMKESLADVIARSGPIAETDALRWLDQVARALEEAHRLGVHHRDIKPENILISGYGDAYLADFGIAALDDYTSGRSTLLALSPAHAPPERLLGDVDSERSGDVYSLASTFYTALTGDPPFGTSSDSGVYNLIGRVLEGRVPRPAGMRSTVHTALATAMSVKPAGRFEGPLALATAMRAGIEEGASDTTDASSTTGADGTTDVGGADIASSAPTVWVGDVLTGWDDAEPVRAEPARIEPVRAEPVHAERVQSDRAHDEPHVAERDDNETVFRVPNLPLELVHEREAAPHGDDALSSLASFQWVWPLQLLLAVIALGAQLTRGDEPGLARGDSSWQVLLDDVLMMAIQSTVSVVVVLAVSAVLVVAALATRSGRIVGLSVGGGVALPVSMLLLFDALATGLTPIAALCVGGVIVGATLVAVALRSIFRPGDPVVPVWVALIALAGVLVYVGATYGGAGSDAPLEVGLWCAALVLPAAIFVVNRRACSAWFVAGSMVVPGAMWLSTSIAESPASADISSTAAIVGGLGLVVAACAGAVGASASGFGIGAEGREDLEDRHAGTARWAVGAIIVTVAVGAIGTVGIRMNSTSGEPHLERFAGECAGGQMSSCDDLYNFSPVGSEFETVAMRCGGRAPTGGHHGDCQAVFG